MLLRRAVLLGCVVLLAASCIPVQQLERNPVRADISGERVQAHFDQLNADELAGRKTSSVGFVAASQYVSSQLRSYGLQPVHVGEFRHVGYGPLNHASGASVRVMGQDTTFWATDREMIPDSRTSAMQFAASSYRFIPVGSSIPRPTEGQIAVLPPTWSSSAIRELRKAGFRMAFVVQPPQIGRSQFSLGLGLIQVSPARLSEILALTESRVAQLLAEGGTGSRSLELGTSASFDPAAGLINTLAYLPGSNPFVSESLVIVAANLDSGGYPAGVSLTDTSRSGIASAALLEVARVLAHSADRGLGPEKTVLFAWFSGGAQGNTGLRSFQANPVWPLDRVDAFILAGFEAAGPSTISIGTDVLAGSSSKSEVAQAGRDLALALREAVLGAAGAFRKLSR